MTGSTLTMASISPRWTAATALPLAPMPTNDASSRLSPCFTIRCCTMKCVRARRGHADLHALEVGRRAVALHFCRQYAEHVAGKLTELHHGDDRLALRLHLDRVVVGPGHHVGAAADQGL